MIRLNLIPEHYVAAEYRTSAQHRRGAMSLDPDGIYLRSYQGARYSLTVELSLDPAARHFSVRFETPFPRKVSA